MNRKSALVFAAALVFHCAGSWSLPLLDRDEPRFAATSRAMLETGDWVVPRLNGAPRYDKPPLVYWLQANAMRAAGRNEFAARFPSAAAAALTALVIFIWMSRLASARAALGAAAMFSLCAHTLLLAKAATADSVMVFGYVACAYAMWAVLAARRAGDAEGGNPGAVAAWAGWAFLAKGPVAFLPAAAAWMSARIERAPRIFSRKELGTLIGLFVLLIGMWAAPAIRHTHGAFLTEGIGRHVVGRGLAPMEGHGGAGLWGYLASLPVYLGTIWISFLPFSLGLWRAGRFFLKKENRDADARYLLVQAALPFAVFSFYATKLPHYVYPSVPFLAMLVALYFERSGARAAILKFAGAVFAAAALIFFLAGFPALRNEFATQRLDAAAAPLVSRQTEIGCYGYAEPSVIWYLGARTEKPVRILQGHEVAPFLAEEGERLCVIPAAKLEEMLPGRPAGWKTVYAEGFNPAKGKRVRLAAVRN